MAYRNAGRVGQLHSYAQRHGFLKPKKNVLEGRHGGGAGWKDDIDIAAGVPKAWGLRRRYPGASNLMDPSDINRTFGPNSSDDSRKFLTDPRMELMRRRRRSGNRAKAWF